MTLRSFTGEKFSPKYKQLSLETMEFARKLWYLTWAKGENRKLLSFTNWKMTPATNILNSFKRLVTTRVLKMDKYIIVAAVKQAQKSIRVLPMHVEKYRTFQVPVKVYFIGVECTGIPTPISYHNFSFILVFFFFVPFLRKENRSWNTNTRTFNVKWN